MAKTAATPAADAQAAPGAAPAPLKFRDQVFTSRTLITPKTGRSLAVSKSQVEVSPDDTEAIAFLKAHKEFQPLTE